MKTKSSVEAIRGFPMEGLLLTIGDQIHENGVLVGCTCHQPRLSGVGKNVWKILGHIGNVIRHQRYLRQRVYVRYLRLGHLFR